MRDRGVLLVSAAAAAAALVVAGANASTAAPGSASCPAAWRAGWQKLADQIHAPVYCPGWMPNPLDGRIGGDWNGLRTVDKQGGYLVSFIYQETGSGEVHVTFHRWPGTKMPRCGDLTSNRQVACYSDPVGTVRANGVAATFYTVSRGVDQWHLSYLWRHDGATYVVSEHVAPPYSFKQVKANTLRILRSLALVTPR